MITLTFAVMVNYFFGQVTTSPASAASATSNHRPLGGDQTSIRSRLYYIALVVALLVYALIRYVVRTPFGLALQGDPRRPGADVARSATTCPLPRTLAFGLAGLLRLDRRRPLRLVERPHRPGLDRSRPNINVLVIAVIGGLSRVEGAWVGALFYYAINNVVQTYLPGGIPSIGGTFNTIIGLAFLLVVVISPDGLTGIWRMGRDLLRRRRAEPAAEGGAT